MSIVDVCHRTSIVPEDVLATLQYLKLVQVTLYNEAIILSRKTTT
jgi:hypothetical protein